MMGVRGRKSKSELSVVSEMNSEVSQRQLPPVGLTKEQSIEWLEIVNSYAADYFSVAQLPMLEAHCRHSVAMRHVGELIRQAESAEQIDVVHYDRLLKMQERESRCLASLAVRLGFAQTTAKDSSKKNPTGSLNGDYSF